MATFFDLDDDLSDIITECIGNQGLNPFWLAVDKLDPCGWLSQRVIGGSTCGCVEVKSAISQDLDACRYHI